MDSKSIFLVFDDIFKSSSMAILKGIMIPEMKENFKEVIDYTKFEFMNDDNLLRFCIQRTEENILKYIGTSDTFDYDKMYDTMYSNLIDKYTPYISLRMVEVIAMAISTPQIKNVYVYSKNFDNEIQTELGLLFNANTKKIKYVYGDLDKALIGKDITLFILPSMTYVNKLYSLNILHHKEVLIANYGYNYKLDENGELVFKYDINDSIINESMFKLRVFDPFDLDDKHMTQMYNNVNDNNFLSHG